MASYCAQSDMAPFLPAGGLPNPARVATSNYALNSALECEGHGLALNATVTLRASVGGTLPAPLAAGVTYYAIPADEAHFKLSATSGGAPITLTADGVNFVFVTPLPFAQWIAWASLQVDSLLPEHVTPLISTPYPPIVVTSAAELAAARGLAATIGSEVDIGARIDAIRVRLAAWVKTIPIRGTLVQQHQPATLAITSSTGATDPRGWFNGDATRIP